MTAFEQPKARVAIVDYRMGNLFNVARACARVGLNGVITSDKAVIAHADAMILPGVGAFGDAMNNLRKMDLTGLIKDHIGQKKPFFGICLGMQLLLSESEEFGGHDGLDIIKGKVIRFRNVGHDGRTVKVPQVGWNHIHFDAVSAPAPLRNVSDGEYMYFVHSFYAVPEDCRVACTMTRYEDTEYCSSILTGSVFAAQFHPEKSGLEGLKIYKNWAGIVNGIERR
jgi:glutamine amidotransferase